MEEEEEVHSQTLDFAASVASAAESRPEASVWPTFLLSCDIKACKLAFSLVNPEDMSAQLL